jgi:hypothetical protein
MNFCGINASGIKINANPKHPEDIAVRIFSEATAIG